MPLFRDTLAASMVNIAMGSLIPKNGGSVTNPQFHSLDRIGTQSRTSESFMACMSPEGFPAAAIAPARRPPQNPLEKARLFYGENASKDVCEALQSNLLGRYQLTRPPLQVASQRLTSTQTSPQFLFEFLQQYIHKYGEGRQYYKHGYEQQNEVLYSLLLSGEVTDLIETKSIFGVALLDWKDWVASNIAMVMPRLNAFVREEINKFRGTKGRRGTSSTPEIMVEQLRFFTDATLHFYHVANPNTRAVNDYLQEKFSLEGSDITNIHQVDIENLPIMLEKALAEWTVAKWPKDVVDDSFGWVSFFEAMGSRMVEEN